MRSFTRLSKYIRHGNNPPSLDGLKKYETDVRSIQTISSKVIHADVLLDLASVDVVHADLHINHAATELSEVLDSIKATKSNPTLYLAASLRRAEISHWRKAVHAVDVTLNYEQMLQDANDAADYVNVDGLRYTRGYLAEFVPLLLLARAQNRQIVPKVTGRLSLVREDQGNNVTTKNNSNWDVGISFDDDPESFFEPTYKIQVKASTSQPIESYRNAGIVVLQANRYSFNDPDRIIDSCFAEQEASLYNHREHFESYELDAITNDIVTGIREQAVA